MKILKSAVIFGLVDGLTCGTGVLMSLHNHPSAILLAAIGLAIAEVIGMGCGEWLSDSGSFATPAAIGIASGVGALIPAFPYLFLTGIPAIALALVMVAVVAAGITWARHTPGSSWLRVVIETYGVLTAVLAATTLLGVLTQ
ncbi:hypothetical protein [Nocardia jiangxiensis]|uniref:hypothetical protein n=1 Tax=Nocardia jiangxiensis TaxID=282685 RepID=UPI000593F68E|nr:hypothetical protein [Nocardia jiangxiensis]